MPASAKDVAVDMHSLYSDHHRWLKRWLQRRLGNEFDAADLAHDTYVRLISSQRLPPVGESRRYLGQIAKGLVIDLFRRRQIEATYYEMLSSLPPVQVPSEEERALTIEALVEVDTILHGLSPKVRAALLMFRLEGLSYRQIATELRVSVSSVEKYIAKALQACHVAMSQQP